MYFMLYNNTKYVLYLTKILCMKKNYFKGSEFDQSQMISASQAKEIDPNIRPGFAIVNKLCIEEILTEEQARTLLPSRTTSIGLILIVPRLIGKTVELLTITERNSYNPTHPTIKFPSFTMKARDGHHENGLCRESVQETDHLLSDFIFVCGGKYTSSIEGEHHYKLCFLAKKHAPASLQVIGLPEKTSIVPTTNYVLSKKQRPRLKLYHPKEPGILSVDWRPIDDVEKRIPKSQRTMFGPIIEKVRILSPDHWRYTPDIQSQFSFMEGEYQTKLYQPF